MNTFPLQIKWDFAEKFPVELNKIPPDLEPKGIRFSSIINCGRNLITKKHYYWRKKKYILQIFKYKYDYMDYYLLIWNGNNVILIYIIVYYKYNSDIMNIRTYPLSIYI